MSFFSQLLNKFNNSSTAKTVQYLDLSDLAELEELFISADLGPDLSMDLVESLRKHMTGVAGIGSHKITREELPGFFAELLRKGFEAVIKESEANSLQASITSWFQGKPKNQDSQASDCVNAKQTIITLIGVNGVGKTTSAAKLAYKYKQEGYNVLLVAADTFRAAATEQLRELASRVRVDIITAESEKEKASAVVYRALKLASIDGVSLNPTSEGHLNNVKARYDVVIIDTAGRLQSKTDLMQELSKLTEVIGKNASSEAKLEMFLVLDASTGQNAISQAELFSSAVANLNPQKVESKFLNITKPEASNLSGLILTKYDGSSKAGMVIALARKFKLLVKFVGTGEGIEDLQVFDLDDLISEIL